MRVVEQPPASTAAEESAADWADQTRRVLTRDLLARAAHARPGEARALEFRALHLNLPLIGEVTDRLGLSEPGRGSLEHHALEGLHEAIHLFDPFGRADFPEFASPFVEHQVRAHLPATSLRLAVHRVALAIAGARV
jgi:hypothetical protein